MRIPAATETLSDSIRPEPGKVTNREQVTEVDRVETPPEETDFHRADRGRGVGTRQGPIAAPPRLAG